MKVIKLSLLVALAIQLTSCASKSSVAKNEVKTYAEISIKEGGKWNGKKYEGGVFKNVQSLVVPPQYTDHSYYIRYEGPGWESNKVGYRLYLDWRNAIDIYGKLTEDMVLQNVGQDGYDSYHLMSDWGADILKVGKGLGIGSIGRVINGDVLKFQDVEQTTARVENTKQNSKVFVDYKGWKTNGQTTNLSSELTIFPNQRYTRYTMQNSAALDGIVTGIVDLYQLPLIKKSSTNNQWAYIATYGKQTLFDDNLGMAILYKTQDTENVFQGKNDYLIQFKPTKDKITYYFLGAWEKEPEGIKTEAEFIKYLDGLLHQLNNTNVLK